MPSQPLAHVNPAVLRWARESAGYTERQAADEINAYQWQVEAAERGDVLLTLRQAEKLADFYARPLATFFMPEAPEEEAQEVLFRRLPGAPALPWGPEMRLLARGIRQRQQAAVEIYDALEEDPPWLDVAQRLQAADQRELSSVARELLGVEREGNEEPIAPYQSLRLWVDAVEALGVLVMQDGSLPVESQRGFASLHPEVPAIVVNSKDDPRARAFSVVHEFGHLVAAQSGVRLGADTERWCEQVAGEVLMPPDTLARAFRLTRGRLLIRVERLAAVFGVTPLAAAVRVARSGLVAREEADGVVAEIRGRSRSSEEPRSGGGNYYWNEISRLGPGFIRLVFTAVDGQALTYPNASTLLGVKVNNFEKLRDYLERRRTAA